MPELKLSALLHWNKGKRVLVVSHPSGSAGLMANFGSAVPIPIWFQRLELELYQQTNARLMVGHGQDGHQYSVLLC